MKISRRNFWQYIVVAFVFYLIPVFAGILGIFAVVKFTSLIVNYYNDTTYIKENNCEFSKAHHSVYEYKCGDKKFYSDVEPTVLSH